MIIIYSDHCPFCRTLLEEVKKLDVQKKIKLVSIDMLKAKNSIILTKVTSVPSLMIPQPDNNFTFAFGKQVFDILLNPQSGLLYQQNQHFQNQQNQQNQQSQQNPNNSNQEFSLEQIMSSSITNIGTPMYSFLEGISVNENVTLEDAFNNAITPVNANNMPNKLKGAIDRGDMLGVRSMAGHQNQQMPPIGAQMSGGKAPMVEFPKGIDTKLDKQDIPDMDKILMQRSTDIQQFINTAPLPPPAVMSYR